MHDFPSIPLEIRHCILSVEFVIAAVHAKAISAFVVPEGKGRGINGDPSAGTAAPLKKLAAKHNARCILNSALGVQTQSHLIRELVRLRHKNCRSASGNKYG